MGRPLSRKMFGPIDSEETTVPDVPTPPSLDGEDQRGYDTSSNTTLNRQGFNMPVEAAFVEGGSLDENQDGRKATPFILRQRSAARFKVRTDAGDGVCKLVDGESALEAGEMVLKGFVDDAGSGVAIRKISGRKVFDFDSRAYTWYVASDGSSVANRIVLTEI